MKDYKTKISRLAKPMVEVKNPFGWNQLCQYVVNKAIAKYGKGQTKDEILEKIWESANESITDLQNWYKSGEKKAVKTSAKSKQKTELDNISELDCL